MTSATVAVTGSGRGLSLGGHAHWFLYSSLTERVRQTRQPSRELESAKSNSQYKQCNG